LPYTPHTIGTRDQLRETFDRVAQQYDVNRPSYPAEVFEDVIRISGINTDFRMLEIGCGTGHATEVFAARGFRIDAIELGENMAAIARQRLAQFPRVSIELGDFDTWTPPARYDLVYSATAYHWLDPATREQRIAAVLRAGGWLAMWRNRHIRNGSSDDFIDAAQPVYARFAPELCRNRAAPPGPDEVIEAEREEFTSGLFDAPQIRVHFWSRRYTAAEYIDLLNTHSDHQLLPADRRSRLFESLAGLIDTRFGGAVIKDYATVLQFARPRTLRSPA
jgi:trans-aconitate methyltransferase